ncbi:MAG TPA: glycosyltransferase family 39 protein [bacterium]|jgi:hypothetical protein|nr:glycosyltransferase family 39 protein [bacterium]HOG38581.1 glycosyltransferase family 39 protein [bacterium]
MLDIKGSFKEIFKYRYYFFWIFLFAFTLYIHIGYGYNQDNGVIINGAWNLINNKILYIDFFEFIPPASFYLIFWLWKIFGVSYFVANLFSIIMLFFASYGIFRISELIYKNKLNYLLPIIFIISSGFWPIINHNAFNAFFMIWACYFIIRGLNDCKEKNFIIAGLLSGISTLFLQQKGAILIISIVSFLIFYSLKEKNKIYLKWCLSYIIFSVLPLFILFLWPIKLIYNNLVYFILFHCLEINYIFPWRLYVILFILLLYIKVFIREKRIDIWFLIFIQFCLLITTFARADDQHILIVIFPLYCLTPLLLKKINCTKFLKFIIYSFITLFLVYIIYTVSIFVTLTHKKIIPKIKPTQNIIHKFVEENCSDSEDVYFGPFLPQLYFDNRKINPTPYDWLITNHHTEAQFKEARQILEKKQPKCAVLYYAIVKKFNYEKNNPVDDYIFKNYKLIFEESGFMFYKKNN